MPGSIHLGAEAECRRVIGDIALGLEVFLIDLEKFSFGLIGRNCLDERHEAPPRAKLIHMRAR